MVAEIKNDRLWEETFHFELVVLLHLILVSSCSGEIIYGTDSSLFSFPQTSEIHDASTQRSHPRARGTQIHIVR